MGKQERFTLYQDRLRELREESRISQEKLGILLNVEQKSVSDYERGRTRTPVDILIRAAMIFDVSMDYICGVSDVRTPFPKK